MGLGLPTHLHMLPYKLFCGLWGFSMKLCLSRLSLSTQGEHRVWNNKLLPKPMATAVAAPAPHAC